MYQVTTKIAGFKGSTAVLVRTQAAAEKKAAEWTGVGVTSTWKKIF